MQQKPGLPTQVYEAFASLKLTLFIFLALAFASLVGTLLPQGLTAEQLEQRFSPGVVHWIQTLGLHDLYRAGWFRVLLFLLCLNLVVCTLQRLPKTIKLVRHREEEIKPEKLVKFSLHRQLTSGLPWTGTKSCLQETINEVFGGLKPFEGGDKSFSGTAEKGRWSRLMVYGVHLSVLLILFGAMLGSVLGFKGFMNIVEGTSSNEVVLLSGNETLTLPFTVRCEKFDVSFYDTGAPKEFRSDLTIVQGGRDVLKHALLVNDPLEYDGITLYQASYGSILNEADVEFEDLDSGKVYKMTLPYREIVTVPDTRDQVQIINFQKDFSRFGTAVAIMMRKEGQKAAGSWILADRPDFHGNRIENYKIKVTRMGQSYYTGIQVKKDPGVWVVLFGFTLMVVGIGLTFYTSHRRLWVHAEPVTGADALSKVIIAGRTSKNTDGFEEEFERLCERLQNRLKPQDKG
ncbi:cytochrome c biogenesis protein ResB [Syntrophobacter fumaroxidans]|uniref:ResB family protein n=1 Tax=Syntrophobacter fumaroxidans (strain DSM 10017 / MPOB) TaxID=335543 RepID=A0LG43_SYNFM|nr:cytochrome c biogenesis protein ResB [Syntrophobacter fumaroxidans]ABK16395.1 ResB family protein [Syntrophobacter fumaroxidans MPOB]